MAKQKNDVPSKPLRLSLDPTTERVLGQMSAIGFHGKNKAEVATWVLREWIWHNPEALESINIRLVEKGNNSKDL